MENKKWKKLTGRSSPVAYTDGSQVRVYVPTGKNVTYLDIKRVTQKDFEGASPFTVIPKGHKKPTPRPPQTQVLKKLVVAWAQYPDLRLGQFLVAMAAGKDVFYLEDDILLERLSNKNTR